MPRRTARTSAVVRLVASDLDGTLFGAEHVPELLRPLRPGGLLVVIMNGTYYETGGFEEKFRQLEHEGRWRIDRLEEFNYMTELTRPGWLLLAEKQAQ